MELKILPFGLTVCKLPDDEGPAPPRGFCFFANTGEELSLVPEKKEVHFRPVRVDMLKKTQKRHLGTAELHGVGDDQDLYFSTLHA